MSEVNESAIDQCPPAELNEYDKFPNIADRDYSPSYLSNLTREQLLELIEFETFSLHTCEMKIEGELTANESDMEVINVLSNRIIDLYNILFKTFEIDVTVVSDYIKFGSKSKVITSKFRNELNELMESFRIDPELYIIGACYAFDDCKDIKSARRYLANGINFHKNYKRLFLEEFDIELKYLNSTEGASFEVVLNKYNRLIKHFKDDVNLHLTLVDKILSYSVVEKLHSIVIRDMVNKYKLSEKMWQKLAKIHWKGFSYNFESELIEFCEDEFTCIRNCITIYENALEKKLFPDNQHILWNYFLDIIMEICNTSNINNKPIKDFMTKKINDTFHQALKNETMIKSKYFIFWIDYVDEDTELMLLNKAVSLIKQDVELWSKLLEFFLYRDLYESAMIVFQDAIHILKNDGMPLWHIMELYLLNTEDSMVIEFYELAIQIQYQDISLEFRPKYLEWSILREGVNSAHKIFSKMKDLEPQCKAIYKDIIRAEILFWEQGQRRMHIVRNLYSEICNKFGKKDIDVWVDCMRFEYTYGHHSCAELIYKVALTILDPNLKSNLTNIKKELDDEFKKNISQEVIEISDDDD